MSSELLDVLRVRTHVRLLGRDLRGRFVHGDGTDLRELHERRIVLVRARLLLVGGASLPRSRRGVRLVPQRDGVRNAVRLHMELRQQLGLVVQRYPRRMRDDADATDMRRAEGLRLGRAVLGDPAEMQHTR